MTRTGNTRLPKQWARALERCRALKRTEASALIEISLICFFFGVPLILGTSEIACVVYDSIEVTSAAHAGALYGMQSLTNAANTAGIIQASQLEASDFGSSLSVSPTIFYACSNAITGTQYTGSNAQANAQSACVGAGNHPLEFIQVNTTITVTPPVQCVGLPSTFVLHGSSVMEVEG